MILYIIIGCLSVLLLGFIATHLTDRWVIKLQREVIQHLNSANRLNDEIIAHGKNIEKLYESMISDYKEDNIRLQRQQAQLGIRYTMALNSVNELSRRRLALLRMGVKLIEMNQVRKVRTRWHMPSYPLARGFFRDEERSDV